MMIVTRDLWNGKYLNGPVRINIVTLKGKYSDGVTEFSGEERFINPILEPLLQIEWVGDLVS